jgi:hypothetical protein
LAVAIQGEKIMRGLKGFAVVAVIVATAATVGACRREAAPEPMKLGADVPVTSVAR